METDCRMLETVKSISSRQAQNESQLNQQSRYNFGLFFSWLLIKYLCLVEKVLEPTEEAKVEMQPDKDEPSEEAQESIPEEVTIEKGKFQKQESDI